MIQTLATALDHDIKWPQDAIEVGYITGAWGLKGWFKIQSHSADPQALFSSKRWYLKYSSKTPAHAGLEQALLKITQAKEHGNTVVACSADIPDRNMAEQLKGASIYVSRQSFPTPDSDEFYWVDLMGLSVFNRDQAYLGKVVNLMDTGAHCVLCIEDESETPKPRQKLIPFVNHFVDEVDQANKRIVVDWGLDF